MHPSRPLVLLMLTACSTSGPSGPDRPEPTPDEKQRYEEAVRLYRERDPGFAALRDELASEPAVAWRLTQMLILEVQFALERRGVGVGSLARAAVGREDPLLEHAVGHLQAMGAAAMPCIVEELLLSPRGDARLLGVYLCGRIGDPAVPALRDLLDEDRQARRAGLLALAALPATPSTLEAFRQALDDPHFTVRATAVEGLAKGGAEEAALLRRVLAADEDAFVRRKAAEALGHHPSRETAEALVDYLGRAHADGDPRAVESAEEALQRLAERRGRRSLEAWRTWLQAYDPGS